MDLGLANRVYVVTGGSQGLGRAGADALVGDGAKVVVCSRDGDRVDQAVAALGGNEVAVGVRADLGEATAAQRLVQAAYDAFGRLDGALLSVGGPPTGTVTDTTDDTWRASFETVFLGQLRCARAVAARLGQGGSIVFVLSSSARSPIPGLATSNGLRPGLAMVAKTLADELGPSGIRVNGLLPGRIDTDRVRSMDAQTGDAEAARERGQATIPMRRYGEPAEFGRVAAFLLSPAASYLNGVMLPVDGGLMRTI
ncbi:MAG: SDR family oxidoreductase [Geodermatophilaceae bacterium]|nr:SDR family oxidoreductase [Geodermatophilaceae bacterium]